MEHGYSPLSLALVLSHEWSARELIVAGAFMSAPAKNGRTPMFVACEKGMSEIIRLAVHLQRVNLNGPVIYPFKLHPLHVACCHKQPQILSLLLHLGADPNIVDSGNGYSPLAMSIIAGCSESSLQLLKWKVNPHLPSREGRSPM